MPGHLKACVIVVFLALWFTLTTLAVARGAGIAAW